MSPPSSDRSPRVASAPTSAGGAGGDSEQCDRGVTGQSESSNCNNGNAKRSAWSRSGQPNGMIEPSPVVMGADSWPSLKESTKPSSSAATASNSKSPPFDSIVAASSDGSPSVASSTAASPSVPVVGNNQMKASNPNPNFNRPKPKRNINHNNQGLQINGGPVSPLMSPVSVETPPTQFLPEKTSPRDMQHNRNNNSNWDHGSSTGSGFSPHSHGGSDYHRPFRRANNNGGHNNGRYPNYSNDWNNPRSMPPPPPHPYQRPHFMRQPPPPPPPPLPHVPAAPFIGQLPHVRPFMGPPMGFTGDIPAHYLYMPTSPAFVTPMGHIVPPVMYSPIDYAALREAILKQIHFYFSTDNLVRDPYLRRQMDEQGLVHVSIIAGFNKMKELTNNIQNRYDLILDSIRTSEVVEVQGKGIRRRNDWKMWTLPANSSQHGSSSGSSGPHSPSAPNVENMANRLQNVVLQGDSNKDEHMHAQRQTSDR